jgi:endonuclease/exonuclease/phosphatase family metal-dependent hydrolase
MTLGSTINPFASGLNSLRIGLFNAENLFLLFDHPIPTHYLKLNEAQWQALSGSVYENKTLPKCIQIAQIIKAEAPDIMMLCEVGGEESLKNFNKLFLDDAYEVALIEGNSDRNIDVGFLIRKDKKIIHKLGSHKERPLNYLYPHEQLSKKTGYPIKATTQYFSRDCAELKLHLPDKNDPYLIILLTHLKSRLDPERIDPGGTERRSAELRTCIDIYKELTSLNPNVPVIFAGDMNGYAGKIKTDVEFLPLYNETDLQDVLEIANLNIEKRSTFYQVKNNSKVEGKQIDYCFLSRHLHDKVMSGSAAVYRYKDEFGFDLEQPRNLEDKLRLPSDHYPLFFTLEKLPV